MSEEQNREPWEARLQAGLGTLPPANYPQWRDRFSGDLDQVAPSPPTRLSRTWSSKTLIRWTLIASVLGIVAGWFWMDHSVSPSAFAQTIPGVDDVRTMTWTVSVYKRLKSKDGKKEWIVKHLMTKNEYRAPGQFRTTYYEDSDNPNIASETPSRIEIEDRRIGRVLEILPRIKTATLKMSGPKGDERSPFAWVGDVLRDRKFYGTAVKSVSLQGPQQFEGRNVNAVRMLLDSGPGWPSSVYKALFDADSKNLVCVFAPGISKDADQDPDLLVQQSGPISNEWSSVEIFNSKSHDIVVNPQLDAADFRLDPPGGYKFESAAQPTVSEEELVEFLKISAGLNRDMFPDSTGWWFLDDAIWKKADSDLTPSEKAAIDYKLKLSERMIVTAPILLFHQMNTQPDSFVYVGSGVKLGEKDRIVCWYLPRQQSKYRIVYGDLTIKDATAADLPLNPNK